MYPKSLEPMRTLDALMRRVDYVYAGACSKLGLSKSEFLVLYELYATGGGCTQSELCDRCGLGKQTINSCIGRLQARELVCSEREGGRRGRMVLTPQGERYCEQRIAPIMDRELQAMANMPKGDLHLLVQLVASLAGNLEQCMGTIERLRDESATHNVKEAV